MKEQSITKGFAILSIARTIAQGLPPMFKKIKKDVFKFRI